MHTPKPSPGEELRRATTNLGDKLREALPSSSRPAADAPPSPPPPPPEPVAAQRKPTRVGQLRPGWKSAAAVSERREFALNVLRQRPHIRERGHDSLDELLAQRFSCGISTEAVADLRRRVFDERAASPVAMAAAREESLPRAAPQREVNTADVAAAAVELILGAVPSLRTFTVVVDDSGEASVDYTVREVVVRETGGSLKVRR